MTFGKLARILLPLAMCPALVAGCWISQREPIDVDPAAGSRIAMTIVIVCAAIAGAAALFLSHRLARSCQAVVDEAKRTLVAPDVNAQGHATDDEPWYGLFTAIDECLARNRNQLETIERDRKNLQNMLRTIPEGVVALDANQRVVFANKSFYKLLDVTFKDVTGIHLWEFVRHPSFQQAIAETLRREEMYATHFEILNPPRWLMFRAQKLTMESGRGLVVALHDITELRKLERMRQEFFTNVSHELKTPLSAIKAYAETLLDGGLDDRDNALRFLGRIEDQADRLHRLVLDMLTLARIESQEQAFDIQPVDIHSILRECVESHRAEISENTRALTLELALTDRTPIVAADAEGVLTILNNLVGNAVKYTPDGGRIVVRDEIKDRRVLIHVSDTGVGIPPEDLTRIFERFYRVDKARSRELGGTGLGLSIVKHLAKTFGGSVSVVSRLNHGSTFTVDLPLQDDDASETPLASDADIAFPRMAPLMK